MMSDQDALARLRELASAKIAAAGPIPDARRPLELILESSLKPVSRDDHTIDLVDEGDAVRVTVVDGQVRSESLDGLVEALRLKHPRLFGASPPAPGPIEQPRTPSPTPNLASVGAPGAPMETPRAAEQPRASGTTSNSALIGEGLAVWDDTLPEAVLAAPTAKRAEARSSDPVAGHAEDHGVAPTDVVPAAWPHVRDDSAETPRVEPVPSVMTAAPGQEVPNQTASPAMGGVRHGSRVAPATSDSPEVLSYLGGLRARLLGMVPAIWPSEPRDRRAPAQPRLSLRDRWIAGKDRVAHWRLRGPDWGLPFGIGAATGLVAGLLLGGLMGDSEGSDASPPPESAAVQSPGPRSGEPGATGTLQPNATTRTAADETGPDTDILRGVPEVLDTGTLRVQDKVVRLFGVEWARGGEARDLAGYLRDREVVCRPVEARGPHRCEVDGRDLSEVVLYNGGGRATDEATPGLKSAENHARSQHLGVWARQQP